MNMPSQHHERLLERIADIEQRYPRAEHRPLRDLLEALATQVTDWRGEDWRGRRGVAVIGKERKGKAWQANNHPARC